MSNLNAQLADAATGPFAVADWKTPEDFGAAGDAVADDGPALVRLSQWLNGGAARGAHLCGRYRVGRRQTPQLTKAIGLEGAITLLHPDRVALVFEGGVLLIDNLDEDGHGHEFHGIVTRGPGAKVWLSQPRVEWLKKPAGRGQGDAIRFYGYPSDTARGSQGDGKLEFIWVDRSFVKWAPQTGMIFSGCSDIVVTNHFALETWADACHFNACRRITAGHIESNNCGDDTCAFVTYHDEKSVEGDLVGIGPYNQPGLGEWNNSEARVQSVRCHTNPASGVRLAGAFNVQVGDISASQTQAAAVVDAAVVGGDFRWTYLQSRQCKIGSITAEDCTFGFVARSENNAYASDDTPETANIADDRYSRLDVSIGSITAKGCEGWGMWVQDIEGLHVENVAITGSGFLLEHVNNATFKQISVMNSGPVSFIRNSGFQKPVSIDILRGENAKILIQSAKFLAIKESSGEIGALPEGT